MKQREATQGPSPHQRDAKDGHERAWKQKEDRRQWGGLRGTVQLIYQIAIRFKIQISPKFM